MGFDMVGVDILASMIEAGKQRYPHLNLQVGDARMLRSFSDETFDAVLFLANGLDFIYPEEGRQTALEEMWRVLKPGGTLIFTSHNAFCVLPWPPLLKVWAQNILSGRVFRSPYRFEHSPYGPLYTYYVNLRQEARSLARPFSDVQILPLLGPKIPWGIRLLSTLLCPFPYFICQK